MIYLSYSCFLVVVLKSGGHLLMCLLDLEGLGLVVFLLMFMNVMSGGSSFVSLIVYMFVMVCEGVMGSGVLIIMERGVGGDKFNYVNMF